MPRAQQKKHSRTPWVLAAIAIAAVTILLGTMRRAAPAVERSAIWIGDVKRGELMRSVRGPGTLVPEHIRWITADTAGRVERILLRPGTAVEPDAVLLELSNPDVELQALEAERQVAAAEAELLNLKSSLASQLLSQRAANATLEADRGDAERRAAANANLLERKLISTLEAQQTSARQGELAERSIIEKERLEVLERGMKEQVAAQREQVAKLRAVAVFRRKQVESMRVRAGDPGVLSDLPLELGQWVTPGTLLAKVVQPDRLKAELRIPETQAKDVALGQSAEIDTRNGIVRGKVSRVAPSANQGAVRVEVSFEVELPKGARPDLSVDGTVELEKLVNVLYVGRPAGTQPESTAHLFKLDADGESAERARVGLGRASVNAVEVIEGLLEGDRVVLSDMAAWQDEERIKLK